MDEQNYIKNLENTFSKVPKTLDSWMDAEKKNFFQKIFKKWFSNKKIRKLEIYGCEQYFKQKKADQPLIFV